jgi:hypothetical protein
VDRKHSLLLHVIDASDPGFEYQIAVTEKIIEEIDAGKVLRLRVFNKIDRVGDAKVQVERAKPLRAPLMRLPGFASLSVLFQSLSGQGRAVPALVGAALARRIVCQLCRAGGTCRCVGRILPRSGRACGH